MGPGLVNLACLDFLWRQGEHATSSVIGQGPVVGEILGWKFWEAGHR